MSSIIKLKRSLTGGQVPSALEAGELAVNLVDKKLFTSNGSSVFSISGDLYSTSLSAVGGTGQGAALNLDCDNSSIATDVTRFLPGQNITVTQSGDDITIAHTGAASIAAGQVGTIELANAGVTTAKIAADAVTLGTLTSGDYVEGVTQGNGIVVTGGTGEGSTPGVALAPTITGLTSVTSTDFVGDLTGNVAGDTAGTHTGAVVGTTVSASAGFAGALTGNVTGNLSGNVTGNVTGNTSGTHTGPVTGAVTGNVTGNLTGVVTGNVTGDLTGNVTGDITGDVLASDASVMVDSSAKAFTGDLTGDVTGNVAGDITGDVLATDTTVIVDSSTKAVTAVGGFSGNLTGNVSGTTVTATGAITGGGLTDTVATITGGVGTGFTSITSTNFVGNVAGDTSGTHTGAVVGTAVSASTGFTGDLAGIVTGSLVGNAATATKIITPVAINIAGDQVGTVNFDGSQAVTITTQTQNDSVDLGTHTTGMYVANASGTANEITVSGGGSETATLSIGLPSDVTIANDLSVTNDTTVGGKLTVTGDLDVNGSVTYIDSTTVAVGDGMIELSKDNVGNSIDIGFYGMHHVGGVDKYSGITRDAATGAFRVFADNTTQPTQLVDYSTAVLGTIHAVIDGGTF